MLCMAAHLRNLQAMLSSDWTWPYDLFPYTCLRSSLSTKHNLMTYARLVLLTVVTLLCHLQDVSDKQPPSPTTPRAADAPLKTKTPKTPKAHKVPEAVVPARPKTPEQLKGASSSTLGQCFGLVGKTLDEQQVDIVPGLVGLRNLGEHRKLLQYNGISKLVIVSKFVGKPLDKQGRCQCTSPGRPPQEYILFIRQ